MSLLNIVKVPDHRLRLQSKPILQITDEIKKLAGDMAETMYAEPGIGLAAIQVGKPIQMIVVDPTAGEEPDGLMTMINPRIVECSKKIKSEEGCLSVPGVKATIERYDKIVVEYIDLEGQGMTLEAEGLLAVVIQHETDHCNGKIFIDRLPAKERAKQLQKSIEFQREERAAEAKKAAK